MNKPSIWGIIGPVGVGKTTLTNALCQYYNGIAIYEEWEDNPFIKEFYKSENLLNNQLWFIKNDFLRLSKALNSNADLIIVDKLFVQNYTYIQTTDFSALEKEKCLETYNKNIDLLKEIDLIINLKEESSVIRNRIKLRSRDLGEEVLSLKWFEEFQTIQLEYINTLSKKYPFKLINYINDSFDISNLTCQITKV